MSKKPGQHVFTINTVSEENYKRLAPGRIDPDRQLTVVDDDTRNRLAVASYDLLVKKANAAGSQLSLLTSPGSAFLSLLGPDGRELSKIDVSELAGEGVLNGIEYRGGSLVFGIDEGGSSREISVRIAADGMHDLGMLTTPETVEEYVGAAVAGKADRAEVPTAVSQLANDAGYADGAAVEGAIAGAVAALSAEDSPAECAFVTAVSQADGVVGVQKRRPAAADVEGLGEALAAKADVSALELSAEALEDGIALKADMSALEMSAESLQSQIDSDEIVRYKGFQNPGDPAPRRTIQLENHDNVSGKLSGGDDAACLAMVSRWNVAEFGSRKIHANLNTSDAVTVNDGDVVVTDKLVGTFVVGDGTVSVTSSLAPVPGTALSVGVWSLGTPAEANAKAYADAEIAKLSAEDGPEAGLFVTAVSQSGGVVSASKARVSAQDVQGLGDLLAPKADVSALELSAEALEGEIALKADLAATELSV